MYCRGLEIVGTLSNFKFQWDNWDYDSEQFTLNQFSVPYIIYYFKCSAWFNCVIHTAPQEGQVGELSGILVICSKFCILRYAVRRKPKNSGFRCDIKMPSFQKLHVFIYKMKAILPTLQGYTWRWNTEIQRLDLRLALIVCLHYTVACPLLSTANSEKKCAGEEGKIPPMWTAGTTVPQRT